MKERILEAATEEIKVHGANFRMDDLAKRLTISKRTLYENFSSKQEIIETIVAHMVEDFHNAHERILNDVSLSTEEKLMAYFSCRSAIFASLTGVHHRELFNKMPNLLEFCHKQCEGDWLTLKEFLLGEQKKGVIADVDIDTVILMLRGLANIILYDSSRNPDECYEYMPKGLEIILRGILR